MVTPMSDGDGVGWVRLGVRGMVPPGAGGDIGMGVESEVAEDMTIPVDGITFVPQDPEPLEPGMGVFVTRFMNRPGEYARPLDEYRREQERKERRKQLKQKARERVKDWKQSRAREFWNQFDIPFQWDVGIKGRLSGLSRGSWGDGRAENTVEHLYVAESFSEGRLSRPSDSYLCDPKSAVSPHFPFEGVRAVNSDGEDYRPPITCKRCLDLMDRWRTGDGDGDE